MSWRDGIKKAAAELKTGLTPAQQRVVDRLHGQPGLVVAHGLGSGKTLASIAAAVETGHDKTRVYVPASLRTNYEKEIRKHVAGKFPVEVRSLQSMHKDAPTNPDLLVIDEAHRARNPSTETFKAIRDAGAKKRMLLTATPIYNKAEDIAPLVNLAAGENLLPIGADFNRRYILQPKSGLLSILSSQKEPTLQNTDELSTILKTFVDYHAPAPEGFPTRTDERIAVPMSGTQTDLHDLAWGKLPLTTRLRMQSGLHPDKKELQALNAFQSQARQIGGSERGFVTEPAITPKLQEAFDRFDAKVHENPNHRAVVYSSFLNTLKDYSGKLTEEGVPHGVFTGDQSFKDRKKMVEDYNDGKLKALLVSSAGGEGLDLKGTRQVQILEPHWNVEKINQVIGRAIRRGSHEHLPEKERSVAVEHYEAYPKPSGVRRLASSVGIVSSKTRGVEQVLFDVAQNKDKLNQAVMALAKSASLQKWAAEYASGLPDPKRITELPTIGGPQPLHVVLQKHETPRGGKGLPMREALGRAPREHFDLRLIPQGSDEALSFALPKAKMPGKGDRPVLAIPQPVHTKAYSTGGDTTIEEGYGRGVVTEAVNDPDAEVTQSRPGLIRFNRYHGRGHDEYKLFQTNKGFWLLQNTTPTRENTDIPDYRPPYKSQPPEKIDFQDQNQAMMPKLDGAHAIVKLDPGRPPRVFSHRRGAIVDPIEYTHKLTDLMTKQMPMELGPTTLRAEVLANGPDGKPLPAEQIGGMLNAGVQKSRQLQAEKGQLYVRPFNVVTFDGKKVEDHPFAEKIDILKAIEKLVPELKMPEIALSPEDKMKLLSDIKEGKHPETREGVVLADMDGPGLTKAKFRPDYDVFVKGIFQKPRGEARGHAGGFEYSLQEDGPVVGRVGTGFDHSLRADMLQNPDKYIGRAAKVFAERVSGKGVLTKPSFNEWHIEKGEAEKLGSVVVFASGQTDNEKLAGILEALADVPLPTVTGTVSALGAGAGGLTGLLSAKRNPGKAAIQGAQSGALSGLTLSGAAKLKKAWEKSK